MEVEMEDLHPRHEGDVEEEKPSSQKLLEADSQQYSSSTIRAARIKQEEDVQNDDSQSRVECIPLQALPPPYELLALATRYLEAAHALSVKIAERPDEGQEQDATKQNDSEHEQSKADSKQANYVAAYRRLILASMTCCRAVLDSGTDQAGFSQALDVKLELRARAMLAELLVRETKGTQEAEAHITKGLSTASKHDALLDYRYRFLYLQVELALSGGNVRFAHNSVKKCIKELSTSHIPFPMWLYRFHFLNIHICQNHDLDYPSALAALRDLAQFAASRNDVTLHWSVVVSMNRVAMLQGNNELSARLMTELAAGFNLPMTNAAMELEMQALTSQITPEMSKEERGLLMLRVEHKDPKLRTSIPRALLMQFLVLLSIYQAYVGEVLVAKQTVKRCHVLLDATELEPGQMEGWVRLDVNATPASRTSSPGKPSFSLDQNAPLQEEEKLSIYLSTLPKPLFYAYTFLVSTIVQIDPVGRSPKCLAYALYGMDSLDAKVRGREEGVFPTPFGMDDIERSIRQVAKIQADLMIYQAELYLMRSAVFEVELIVADLVAFLSAHDLWSAFSARVTLIRGMLYHSLGDLDAAFECYTVALDHCSPQSQLGIVCRASVLFIRLAQGYQVKMRGDRSSRNRSQSVKLEQDEADAVEDGERLEEPEEEEQEDLEGFARALLDDCGKGTPTVNLLGVILESLTNGEIVRAKACLKAALQLSNQTNNQHIKPIILALLACYFSHTESDQAQKMLHSAHTICRSMGSHQGERSRSSKDKKEKSIGPESVGMVQLGLWTGRELLESYEKDGQTDKARKQELYNAAHLKVLQDQIKPEEEEDVFIVTH